MGRADFILMEFSLFIVISGAVFGAHGSTPPDKNGGKVYESSSIYLSEKELESAADITPQEISSNEPSAAGFAQISPTATAPQDIPYKGLDTNTYTMKKNDKKQYNRKFKYDPALALMGLGKRLSQYDPALKYMGLGKRLSQFDPALKYMGLGKRHSQYDPALKYMGIGKRHSKYDPALKYMGIGKRQSQYDPALKYMGLGKRRNQYDPALKYMGLGKRQSQYDPALKYMGLGKRYSPYDPALKYIGLGKRQSQYDPTLKYMDQGNLDYGDDSENNSGENYNLSDEINNENIADGSILPYEITIRNSSWQKRQDQYDPAFKYTDLGKRQYLYDPAVRYMGLGKRKFTSDPAMKYMSGVKRKFSYDPAMKYMGLGKREFQYDPAMKYMGLGKREYDSSVTHTFGKRIFKYDPGMKFIGLGKKNYNVKPTDSDSESASNSAEQQRSNTEITKDEENSRLQKRSLDYISPGSRDKEYVDILDNVPGLGKRPYKFDPALKLMGLGKRRENFEQKFPKPPFKFDPVLKYMSLGKRKSGFQEGFDERNFIPENLYNKDKQYKTQLILNERGGTRKQPEKTGRQNNVKDLSKGNKQSHTVVQDADTMFIGLEKRINGEEASLFDMGQDKGGLVPDNRQYYGSANSGENPYKSIHGDMSFGKPEIIHGGRQSMMMDILQLVKHSNETGGCGNSCLKEILRGISTKMNSVDLRDMQLQQQSLIPNTQSNAMTNSSLDRELPITDGWNEIKEYQLMSQNKRDRDNRPKYNPGWIFIGLGKKRDDQYQDISSEIDTGLEDERTELGDNFDDYHVILSYLKDKIQDMNFGNRVGGWYSSLPNLLKNRFTAEFPHSISANDFKANSSPPTTIVPNTSPPDATLWEIVPTIRKVSAFD